MESLSPYCELQNAAYGVPGREALVRAPHQLWFNVFQFPFLSWQLWKNRHLVLRKVVPPFVTGNRTVVHDIGSSDGRGLLAWEAGNFAVLL